MAALPTVERQAEELRRLLESKGVNAEVLRVAGATGDVARAVLDKLRCGRQWHLVHFCGRLGSLGDEAGLILRGERRGFLSVRQLTAALDRVQLLFLSSCPSASAPEVMQAVEEHVPALIGFQWVIDAEHASEFATAFDHWLFERNPIAYQYVEYAFTKARWTVHEQRPEMPSWVAPVLVMQTAWSLHAMRMSHASQAREGRREAARDEPARVEPASIAPTPARAV